MILEMNSDHFSSRLPFVMDMNLFSLNCYVKFRLL